MMSEFDGGPASRDYWNRRAADYDALFLDAPIRATSIDLILQAIPDSATRVLDLGSGTGQFGRRLATVNPDVSIVSLDISLGMLRRAPSPDRLGPVCGNFVSLPFASGTFDVVVSVFAIHHVSDSNKARVATEIHRVLRPGGSALLVDELLSDPSLVTDAKALDFRMKEIFYPSEDLDRHTDRFAGFVEWPTTVATFVNVLRAAHFSPLVDRLNDIVAFVRCKRR